MKNILIAEVDWDTEKALAKRYSVVGVPTLIVFYHGRPIGRYFGVVDEGQFLELCDLEA